MEQWKQIQEDVLSFEKKVGEKESLDYIHPISNGVYLPTPFCSVSMCQACEVDTWIRSIPGEKRSLFSEDPFAFLVIGDDKSENLSIGWAQYIMYRSQNSIGWSNIKKNTYKEVYLDVSRLVPLLSVDPKNNISAVKESNPEGIHLIIQTSPVYEWEHYVNLLHPYGTLIKVESYPISMTVLKKLMSTFDKVDIILPYWTNPVSLLDTSVYIIASLYKSKPLLITNATLNSAATKKVEEFNKYVQNKYINIIPNTIKNYPSSIPYSLLTFLTDEFPSWDI
jgi:hypothetical protein